MPARYLLSELPANHAARNDCFCPPAEAVMCRCLHCLREFMSSCIEWREDSGTRTSGLRGFWCCPYEDCDGKGYTFDIFPVDDLFWSDDADEGDDDEIDAA